MFLTLNVEEIFTRKNVGNLFDRKIFAGILRKISNAQML